MGADFMDRLEQLRLWYGRSMIVGSGFRCVEYNNVIGGKSGGAHIVGKAVDVLIHSRNAWELVRLALQLGFPGIGIHQKGDWNSRYIHLDWLQTDTLRPRIWSY